MTQCVLSLRLAFPSVFHILADGTTSHYQATHLTSSFQLLYSSYTSLTQASQVALEVKNPPANSGGTEMQVQSLGQEDPLKGGMATHSSILVWRVPWTEEPGGLQSTDQQRVGHD